MARKFLLTVASGMVTVSLLAIASEATLPANAQEQTPKPVEIAISGSEVTISEPLSDAEMEVLVARIALYPDELVAVIVAASLYPVQIVQAQRYLDQVKAKPSLKPDRKWDGSVISLLNYPEIVRMMNDDLDWTEALGDAVTNQEKELLEAIQQLRDKAVAKGILKSDEKTTVVHQGDKVIVQPTKADEIYIPNYEPQMLYESNYAAEPISYYPEVYPYYYYPTAPYFPGYFAGALWGAAIDWNDWGVWGGYGGWGNDLDIDCNNCFNNRNFNGKMNWNNVDWNNVDRSKVNFDSSQFNKLDSNRIRNDLKNSDRNSVRNKANDVQQNRRTAGGGDNRQVKDVRKSTMEGLKKQGGNAAARQGDRGAQQARGGGDRTASRPSGARSGSGKAKPAARADTRSRKPSPMGDVSRGRSAKNYSNRGGQSMGGGYGYNRGGGGAPRVYHHGGGRGYGGGYGGGGRGGFGGGGGGGGGRGGRR